ncbi:MAG: hypothetical protein ACYTF6_02550 [Planctomycetota bacterium]|jgi:hypothetical protein
MKRLGAKGRITAVFAGITLSLPACAGCNGGPLIRRGTLEQYQDSFLKIAVTAHPVKPADRGEVACEIRVKNISSAPIAIFDDPQLPTTLLMPGKKAYVFYGLTRMPAYRLYETPERFRWSLLAAGQSHTFTCTVTNPLRENSHYGNPIYDDPESRYHGRKPESLAWDELLVKVGYFVFEKGAASELRREKYWDQGIIVNGSTLLSLQREISLALRPSD